MFSSVIISHFEKHVNRLSGDAYKQTGHGLVEPGLNDLTRLLLTHCLWILLSAPLSDYEPDAKGDRLLRADLAKPVALKVEQDWDVSFYIMCDNT